MNTKANAALRPAFFPALLAMSMAFQGCASRGTSVLDQYRLDREARLRAAVQAVQNKRFQDESRLAALSKAEGATDLPPFPGTPGSATPAMSPQVASQAIDATKVTPWQDSPQVPAANPNGPESIDPGEPIIRILSDFSGVLYVDGSRQGKIKRNLRRTTDLDRLDVGKHHIVLSIPGGTYIDAEVTLQARKDSFVYFQAGTPRTGNSMGDVGLDDGN
jgi:hypothetical protein